MDAPGDIRHACCTLGVELGRSVIQASVDTLRRWEGTEDGIEVRNALEEDLDDIVDCRESNSREDSKGKEKHHEGHTAIIPVPPPWQEVAKLSLVKVEAIVDRNKMSGAV